MAHNHAQSCGTITNKFFRYRLSLSMLQSEVERSIATISYPSIPAIHHRCHLYNVNLYTVHLVGTEHVGSETLY